MKNSSSKNDIEIGMKAIRLYHKGISQHMKKYIKIFLKNFINHLDFILYIKDGGKQHIMLKNSLLLDKLYY